MKRVLWLILVAALSGACASAQAKAPADHPTLDVPPPPVRTIEPMPRAESAGPEPVPDLPTSSSPAPPSRPRPNPTREAPPRTESKPPEPAPTTEPTPPATPPAPIAPAPQLRTPGSVDGPQAAKQVRDLIEGAKKALYTIDFQKLNDAQRGQYKNAQMMLTQAEEQLKASNFDLARNNADKANRIATELQGR